MIYRTSLAILLICFSFGLFNVGIINSAYAKQPNSIYGKVTDIIDVKGYTYVEVDTGKKKVWAAGPTTQLKIGDMIAFLKGMPMENFRSKSMKRDFPILYFVSGFVSDEVTSTSKATVTASPHNKIKKKPVAKLVKEINKVEDGNTIAEIYANKNNFKGKTIRLRGQVTKFTPAIMGKNWLHIRDSSTLDDLTVTTDSMAAIDDIVVIEGKLELDKDYSYGYVYAVIVEDAKITKE